MGIEYEIWMVAFETDCSQSGRKPVLNDALPCQFFFVRIIKPLPVQF